MDHWWLRSLGSEPPDGSLSDLRLQWWPARACDPPVGWLRVYLGDVLGRHFSCGSVPSASEPRQELVHFSLAGDELQMLVVMNRRSSPCCSSGTWGFGRSFFYANFDPTWDLWGFLSRSSGRRIHDLRSQVTTRLPEKSRTKLEWKGMPGSLGGALLLAPICWCKI